MNEKDEAATHELWGRLTRHRFDGASLDGPDGRCPACAAADELEDRFRAMDDALDAARREFTGLAGVDFEYRSLCEAQARRIEGLQKRLRGQA